MSKRPLHIDADTDAILNRLAHEREVAPEAIVSEAIRVFDELYDHAALEELDRRWADFERNGESYSQEEVETWLNTWGTRTSGPSNVASEGRLAARRAKRS